tara:strand:- start:32 stop:802 length:771 start_codon:yes stop_codon:yes gene_type:complete
VEATLARKAYRKALNDLQIELVKVQRHVIAHGHKVLVLFEGRDASGKDGTIKRVSEHLSPRDLRVVALGKPGDADQASWYFQRYVAHLPQDGQIVLFNRSWYNRAGVERVMGFASAEDVESFFRDVMTFENLLIDAGFAILKIYLDISREEQAKRLARRESDPLKAWKSSPIDAVALEKWQDYTEARNDMLERTSSIASPWLVINADDKRFARLEAIRLILSEIPCPLVDQHQYPRDPSRTLKFDGEIFSNSDLHA